MQCVSESGPYEQYSGGIPHAPQYRMACGVVTATDMIDDDDDDDLIILEVEY